VTVVTPPMGGRRTSPLIPPRPTILELERGQKERWQEGTAHSSTTPIVKG